jgi:hypothetical protein
MLAQWVIVAAIGALALFALARHFGLGRKSTGCPGCNACEKPQRRRVA